MSQEKEADKFLTTMKKSFNYLTKLKKVTQKRKSITFFKNFITDQITRTRERQSMLIHRKQLDDEYIDSFEDLLIQELEKPLIRENQLNDIISFNSHYRTHFNNLKERNIDMMIFLLKHFSRCRKYIRMNSFTDELLRILVSLSTTEHFCKGTPIYRMNTKSTSFYLVIKGSVSIKTLDPQKIKEELGKKNENYKNRKNLDKAVEKTKIEKFFDDHEKEHVSQGVSDEYLVSESNSSDDSFGLNIYNYNNKLAKTTEESADNNKEEYEEEKKEMQKEDKKEETKEEKKEEKIEEKKEEKKEGAKEDKKEEKKEDNKDNNNKNKDDDIYSDINSNKDDSKNSGDKDSKSVNNKKKSRNKIDFNIKNENHKKENDNEDQIDMNIYNSFSSEEQIKKNKSRILRKDTLLDRIQRIKENKIKRRGGNVYQAKYVTSKLLNQDLLKLQKNLGCQIKVINQGSFFGEWDLIYDRPRQNFAYAEEDTDLLVLDKQYFDKYFLKHISKADIERKYFITRSIPLLKIENLPNLHLEFFDKDSIVYTNFDKATEFFIIFQGQGALKKLKLKSIKNKNDIIKHKHNLETIWFVDKGCIVGLETGRKNLSNYDNIFMITEDNTALYRISLNDAINSNYNYKLKKNLKDFLYDLYCKQNNIFKQIDEKKNLKSSVGYIKKEKEKEKEEDDVEKNQELINTIYKEEINYNVQHNTHHYHHFMLDTQSFGSFESLKNFKNKTGFNFKEKFPKIRNHLFKENFHTMPNKNNREIQNSHKIDLIRNKDKLEIDSNFTHTLPNKKYNSVENKFKFKHITSDEFMTIIKDRNINKAKSNNRLKKMKNTNNLFLNYAKNSNYLKTFNKSKKNKLLLKKNKSTKIYNSFKKSSIGNINITSTGISGIQNNPNNKNIMTLTSSLSIQKDDNKYNENILFKSQMDWRKSLTNRKFIDKASSLTNLKRNALGKNMNDKYLYIMLNIPKRNNYYNSGNFNVPLVGSKNS